MYLKLQRKVNGILGQKTLINVYLTPCCCISPVPSRYARDQLSLIEHKVEENCHSTYRTPERIAVWQIVMCGLGLCHKPVTGPEKPDCFSDATAFGLKICWHIWKLVPIVNTIPQKKAQNSMYGNLFATFFRMCQRHRIWIADACRNLFYFCLSHVLQSVTLSGLLRAFEGLCHRPEPAHHYSGINHR